MQNRSQGGTFSSSSQQKLSKVRQISMVRQHIRIYLPWPRASYKNFNKITKSPNCPLDTGQHSIIIYLDHMLLMGRTLPEILMARDTLVFLLQHLGFLINLKKSVLHLVKQIEFKSPNFPLDTGQHSNHYLSPYVVNGEDATRNSHSNHYLSPYVVNGEDVTRNSHGKRHIDFSIATFGFCDQPQKISPAPC